jgi:CRISPR-associated endonuclease Cas1
MPIVFKNFNKCVPAFSGRWTPIYLEHGRLEIDDSSVKWVSAEGTVIRLPAARLSAILLGPGTTITHAAVTMLSRLDTPVVWVGEDGVRFYAFGVNVNEKCETSMEHACLYANTKSRENIARKMFSERFPEEDVSLKTIEELRGMEGYRVRKLYQDLSEKYGVFWQGRNSSGTIQMLGLQDDINKIMTLANHTLYCICLSAIVTMGYLPALGFIHVDGKIPFVYDIADLYKTYITIEPSFKAYKRYRGYDKDMVLNFVKEAVEENKIVSKIPSDLKRIICS